MKMVILLLPWTAALALLLMPGDFRVPIAGWSALAAGSLWLLGGWRPLQPWLAPVRPVLGLMAVIAAGWQIAQTAHSRFDPWPLEPDTVYQVEGEVVGLPDQDWLGRRLRLRVDCVSQVEEQCDLYQRRHPFWPVLVDVSAAANKWPQPPLPGQRWRFSTHVAPTVNRDPFDSFDLARWLKASHVVARFRLKSTDTALRLDEQTTPLQMARLRLREAVAAFQEQVGAEAGLSGLPVVLALITGDRALMTQDHWRIFNNTGTTHLIAISGSHIMLVTAFVVAIFHFFLRRWLWLTQRVPALNMALLLGWGVALIYGGIAGLDFPVQRALIMLTLVVLFKWWGRAQPLWLAWNIAFCLVVVWDPMAVFSLGFWLSFIAVYWILWVSGGSVQRAGPVVLWVRVQWGIFIGLAPVLLWQLQNLSLVSGPTNAFAIPLVGLVLTPLSLLWALCWGMFGDSANLLLWPAKWLAELTIWLLQWWADTPFSVLTTSPRDMVAMLLALLGVIWLCTAGIPGRWLAPLLLLPLLLPQPPDTGLQIMTGPAAPRILLDNGDEMLFVTPSEWPRLDSRWQQNWLRYQGMAPPGQDVHIQQAAAFWQAPHWALSRMGTHLTWFGSRRVHSQSFADLCEQQSDAADPLRWQIVQRNPRSGRCILMLEWQGQHLLLMDTLSLKEQETLLQALQQTPPDYVLMHPAGQGRWLPALLHFWQQEKVQIMLTQPPDAQWWQPFAALDWVPWILADSGPVKVEPATP